MAVQAQIPFDAFFVATRGALGKLGPARFYGALQTVLEEARSPSAALNGSADLLSAGAARLVQQEVEGTYSTDGSWGQAAAAFMSRARPVASLGEKALETLLLLVSEATALGAAQQNETPVAGKVVELDPSRVLAQFALLKTVLENNPSSFNDTLGHTGIKPVDMIATALSVEDKKVKNAGLQMAAFVFNSICGRSKQNGEPIVIPQEHALLVASTITGAATISLKEDPLATSARRALDALAHSLVPEMPRNKRTPLHSLTELVPQR